MRSEVRTESLFDRPRLFEDEFTEKLEKFAKWLIPVNANGVRLSILRRGFPGDSHFATFSAFRRKITICIRLNIY